MQLLPLFYIIIFLEYTQASISLVKSESYVDAIERCI